MDAKDIDFSKDEFVLFVYLCLIMADGQMKSSEINHIFDRLDESMFDESGKNGQLIITLVFNIYKKLDSRERSLLMRKNFKKHFLTKDSAYAFISQLHALMESDGLINEKEEELYHEILSMID
jgi:uncharacterized tellurite resistance protein B-like protein